MMKRHKEKGESTAEQVMEAAGYQLTEGMLWKRADGKLMSKALVNRIWEMSGPKALELTARGR